MEDKSQDRPSMTPRDASSLTQVNAEKIHEVEEKFASKVEGWASLINTPTGLAAVLAIIGTIGTAIITPMFTRQPPQPEKPIEVIIKEMPKVYLFEKKSKTAEK